jgi:GMP synthase-like glutamine amidotransferase
VPTLQGEIALTRNMLDQGRPVLGFGLGAQILAIAAGGVSEAAPLTFDVGHATRLQENALGGFMPERFPHVTYMRDRPVPPVEAQILAADEEGRPAVFQVGGNALGFCGHPGFKTAMAEDLVMEFEEAPEDPAPKLQELQLLVPEIEDALVPIMTGIVKVTGLMQARRRIPLSLKS